MIPKKCPVCNSSKIKSISLKEKLIIKCGKCGFSNTQKIN